MQDNKTESPPQVEKKLIGQIFLLSDGTVAFDSHLIKKEPIFLVRSLSKVIVSILNTVAEPHRTNIIKAGFIMEGPISPSGRGN